MTTQDNWRFCTKCYSLFWYGYQAKGVCPAKGGHTPFEAESPTHAGPSWDYSLEVVSESPPPPSPGGGSAGSAVGTQRNWHFCTKCFSLFWYGYPTAGVCPAGGAHSPLESDSPTHAGPSWDYSLQVGSTNPPPLPFTWMSWGPSGTGALSDSSSTAGSAGNECQYQASLTINQDGSFSFSGYYENRGDVWWGTAPPQAFVVAFIVLDGAGKGYSFTYSGDVPSAPQPGSVAQWKVTQKAPVIAENWDSIAAKNYGITYWYNNYNESVGDVLGQWVGAALNWLDQNAGPIIEVVGEILSAFAGGDGGGTDSSDVLPHSVPLPADVPAGAAASAGGSEGWLRAPEVAGPAAPHPVGPLLGATTG